MNLRALKPDQWIVEGIMTTAPAAVGAAEAASAEANLAALASAANVAPMGPIVEADFRRLILRPFRTSTTYRNLKETGQGVFHVTDDVLLIARAAVGRVPLGEMWPVLAARQVRGVVLAGCCRYYEIQVESLDDAADRTTIVARVVHQERLRDFFGFNRARHAVIEAAILATRVHLTGTQSVLAEMDRLQLLVDKTGSEREHQAMNELRGYVLSRGSVSDKH